MLIKSKNSYSCNFNQIDGFESLCLRIFFAHKDYPNEVPPKFEIFDNRIEITSAGGLLDALNQEEFFEGVSIPRNKELMRVFRDLDMVEQLGSGVPRILESYPKECFRFIENFTRMTFPINDQANDQAKSIDVIIEGGPIGGPMNNPIGSPIRVVTGTSN